MRRKFVTQEGPRSILLISSLLGASTRFLTARGRSGFRGLLNRRRVLDRPLLLHVLLLRGLRDFNRRRVFNRLLLCHLLLLRGLRDFNRGRVRDRPLLRHVLLLRGLRDFNRRRLRDRP